MLKAPSFVGSPPPSTTTCLPPEEDGVGSEVPLERALKLKLVALVVRREKMYVDVSADVTVGGDELSRDFPMHRAGGADALLHRHLVDRAP